MNTNPGAKKILCYGDSNTWGQKPDKSGRFPANIRWTGQLQVLLGDEYYIVEEGLGSRTTDLEYDRKPGRNGKTYLVPCLISHSPLDVVIIMLGTNDLKTDFHRSAKDIANALSGLVDDIRQFAVNTIRQPPQIILIAPIAVNDQAPRFYEFYTGYYDATAKEISADLATEIAATAALKECIFADASTVAEPGEDGLHLSESSNKPLAILLAGIIKNL